MANRAPREGITYEQVAAVADAMVGDGLNPTIRGIRETIGGWGLRRNGTKNIHKHSADSSSAGSCNDSSHY